MIFDPMYLLFVGPALLLSIWATFKTKSAFKKYSKVRASSGLTGAQAAQRMLDVANIHDVEVVSTSGMLSDHYNPLTKKLALSEGVYGSPSVAAIGVACHEAGHAIQHAKGYKPLWLRSILVRPAQIGSSFGVYAAMFGLILGMSGLLTVGIILFSAALAFQVVTLPVEFDASSRAKKLAPQMGIIIGERESEGVDKVLNAAALTYVAAALTSLMTLLYFLSRRD